MRQVNSVLGPFLVWDSDHLGQVLESGAFWDLHLKPFLDEADPSGWALDLGASVGFLTRYLASRYAQVLAVEAHPGTFELLTQNIPDPNVILHHGVAYDRNASFTLMADSDIGWAIPADLNACWNASSIAFIRAPIGPFRGLVVDDVVPEDAPVSLIKVDVQGCDLRALRGLRRTLRRCRPLVVFELEEAASAWHGDDWDDYAQFFAREGYTVTRIREDLWDYVARPQ